MRQGLDVAVLCWQNAGTEILAGIIEKKVRERAERQIVKRAAGPAKRHEPVAEMALDLTRKTEVGKPERILRGTIDVVSFDVVGVAGAVREGRVDFECDACGGVERFQHVTWHVQNRTVAAVHRAPEVRYRPVRSGYPPETPGGIGDAGGALFQCGAGFGGKNLVEDGDLRRFAQCLCGPVLRVQS